MRKALTRPRVVQRVIDHHVEDIEGADRMTSQLAEAAGSTLAERRVLTVDLVVGENRINHGLGARARGANVCPSVASDQFAWALVVDGDRQVIIVVVGVDQPGATVEVYR